MTILLCVLPPAAGKQFRAPMGVPVRLLCELKAGIKEKSTSLPYLQGHYSNPGLPPLFIISGRQGVMTTPLRINHMITFIL